MSAERLILYNQPDLSFSQRERIRNLENLKKTPNSGNGIVMGMLNDGQSIVQAHWLTNSESDEHKAKFDLDEKNINVRSLDNDELKYGALVEARGTYLIFNGPQSESIAKTTSRGYEFSYGVMNYQNTIPNETPTLSAIFIPGSSRPFRFAVNQPYARWKSSKIKFNEFKATPGVGFMTYTHKEDPDQEQINRKPVPISLPPDARSLLANIWESLNPESRNAVVVKTINPRGFKKAYTSYISRDSRGLTISSHITR